jgi:hypothetical protein
MRIPTMMVSRPKGDKSSELLHTPSRSDERSLTLITVEKKDRTLVENRDVGK